MEKLIASSYKNIGGLIVQKQGETVYETYQNDCTPITPVHIYSATKSITSILIGIAIDQGCIQSVDQKILEFFPEYKANRTNTAIQDITLKNLLTMTAPYRYRKPNYTEFFESPCWWRYALDQLGGRDPIGQFLYAGIIGPDILSEILVRTTGKSVLDYAVENLFTPLGITVDGNVIFTDKETQLAWYDTKEKHGWVADRTGVNTAGWGLSLSATDMMKLGELYRGEGQWDGKQIVSKTWVKESTTEHSRWEKISLSYGYLWWLIDENEHSYAAMGDGGNVIYVNPTREMVIAIASYPSKNVADRIKLIRDYILPVFEG